MGECVPRDPAGLNVGNVTEDSSAQFETGWNATERDCTAHDWLWRHPTDEACPDGFCDGADETCIDNICYLNVGESKFEQDVSKGLQDVLVCIEMFLAAICHTWCFTYKAHIGNEKHEKKSTREALRDMANWSDVGEHGLLGVKQIAIDSKNFAKGIKRGMQDPEDLAYYWPQARFLQSEKIAELRDNLSGELTMREHKRFLTKVPALAALSENQIDAIAAQATVETYQAGDAVVHEGEWSCDLYVVLSGMALASKANVGGGMPIMKYMPGQYFGGTCMYYVVSIILVLETRWSKMICSRAVGCRQSARWRALDQSARPSARVVTPSLSA